MSFVTRLMDWIASTKGVLMIMTGVMIGMTWVQAANYQRLDLPAKWWLVAFSSIAAGAGLWGIQHGTAKHIRAWCGIFWALYGAVRSLSWLEAGSLSASLSWVPCVLLGLVVFGRRHSAPYVRDQRERET